MQIDQTRRQSYCQADTFPSLLHRYGAFALAMILSLVSAVPIVFVCRLPECAREGLNPLPSWGSASRFED